jgi:hypothetical protein
VVQRNGKMLHDEGILSSKSIKSSNNDILTFIKRMNVVIQGVQKGHDGGVLLMDGLTEFTVTGNDGLEQANVMD